jgi:hypothetical protein
MRQLRHESGASVSQRIFGVYEARIKYRFEHKALDAADFNPATATRIKGGRTTQWRRCHDRRALEAAGPQG